MCQSTRYRRLSKSISPFLKGVTSATVTPANCSPRVGMSLSFQEPIASTQGVFRIIRVLVECRIGDGILVGNLSLQRKSRMSDTSQPEEFARPTKEPLTSGLTGFPCAGASELPPLPKGRRLKAVLRALILGIGGAGFGALVGLGWGVGFG